jgi:hypothetical protein
MPDRRTRIGASQDEGKQGITQSASGRVEWRRAVLAVEWCEIDLFNPSQSQGPGGSAAFLSIGFVRGYHPGHNFLKASDDCTLLLKSQKSHV